MSGVTMVRDMGGRDGIDLCLRDAIRSGLTLGPRMVVSRQMVCMTGGHGWPFGREADGPDEVRKAAREQIRGGADLVKFMATGGVMTPSFALLLADEPTTALDVTIQAQILSLMMKLKEEFKTSILLITHDLGVISEMASRVAVMYAGKIVEEAPVRDLFKDPRHPYTRGLLGSVPVIGKKAQTGRRLQEIPGMVPSPLEMPSGCSFHPRCPGAMPVCSEQEPKMVTLGEHRRVQCWLAG
jgi:peptide/nickel transport system ATP-binding protein